MDETLTAEQIGEIEKMLAKATPAPWDRDTENGRREETFEMLIDSNGKVIARPVIFSAPMVCALLDGRKSMTRRLISSPLRKALPGDRLYVRESCWIYGQWHKNGFTETGRQKWRFQAIGQRVMYERPTLSDMAHRGTGPGFSNRKGMHQPRWASRLTLVVTDVRFEGLQDISEEDARAEGIPPVAGPTPGDEIGWQSFETYPDGKPHPHAIAPNREARRSFRELWEMLHGHGTWAENPELVVIGFETHRINIDRMEIAP